MPQPNIAFQRADVRLMLRTYRMIADVIAGEDAVKGYSEGGTTAISGANGWENIRGQRNVTMSRRYLPQPNPADTSPENRLRYIGYVERAVWYGATARTLDGMTGAVFSRPPVVTLPDTMQPLLDNIDGSGVSSVQQMKRAVDDTVAYGRGGLRIDYPATDGTASQADVSAGKIMPVIKVYEPWQIINWKTIKDGAKTVFTLVVVVEDVDEDIDGFETRTVPQYTVMEMIAGEHVVTIYRPDPNATQPRVGSKDARQLVVHAGPFKPLMGPGKSFDHIPFTFYGSKNNDVIVDKPPLQDIATMNIGHFRNSADYEDAVHLLGQPTPYATGLTQAWVKNVWESKKIPLGSRAVIPLPVGAAMGLLQASENSMVREAMKDKESQMVALGAKLIEPGGTGNGTATEALIDETSETSVLTNCATNVGAAYLFAFKEAALFMGIDQSEIDKIKVEMNTSFSFSRMSAGDRQELVNEWQKGAISFTEMRTGLRGAGIATLKDVDALEEIKKEQEAAIATGFAFGPMGIDPPVTMGAAKPIAAPPEGQAPNPVPPATKKKPAGKGPNA